MEDCASLAWFSVFQLAEAVSGMLMASVLNWWFGGWYAVLPTLVVLPFSLLMLRLRERRTVHLLDVRKQADDQWTGLMSEIITNWTVIFQNQAQLMMVKKFEGVYAHFMQKHDQCKFHALWTKWCEATIHFWGLGLILGFIIGFRV